MASFTDFHHQRTIEVRVLSPVAVRITEDPGLSDAVVEGADAHGRAPTASAGTPRSASINPEAKAPVRLSLMNSGWIDRRMASMVADYGRRSMEGCRQDFREVGFRPMMQQRRFLRSEPQPRLLLPADPAMIVHAGCAGVHHGRLIGFTKDPIVRPQRGADKANAAKHDRVVLQQVDIELGRVRPCQRQLVVG